MTRPTPQFPPLGVEHLENRLTPALLDLTTHASSGAIGDGLFQQYDARPTGTGKIDSFLRVQGASSKGVVQQGFNTSARPLQFNENKSPNFTRDLTTAELPVVNVGGTNYREFLLDINQKSSQPYLSLDALKVFVTDAATKSAGFDVSTGTLGGAAPVYDMDAGENSWVKLDYRLNTGSGSGDMLFYLPESLFAGGQFVTVYSKFGEHFASNAGFQEWAVGVGGSVDSVNLGGIAGRVFIDSTVTGTFRKWDAGEAGVPNQVVFLDADGDGRLGDSEVYAITGADGRYGFDQLLPDVPGGYRVRMLIAEDINQVFDFLPPGGDPSILLGYSRSTTDPDPIFIAPGQFVDDVDFGFYSDGSES
jgi:hypothetical protein